MGTNHLPYTEKSQLFLNILNELKKNQLFALLCTTIYSQLSTIVPTPGSAKPRNATNKIYKIINNGPCAISTVT